MFTIKPKNVYDSVKPLAYSNCFFGMGVARQPNQSRAMFNVMKVHTVTFAVYNWITIYITLNSIGKIIDFKHASPMALMMYKVLVSVNSAITVIAPVLLWIRKKRLQDCLRRMHILDETFQNVLGARNEHRRQYICLMWQIMAIMLAMCLVGLCDTILSLKITLKMDLSSILLFSSVAHTLHYPILVMLVLDLNFCFFVRYLGRKIRDMNNSLLRAIENPSVARTGKKLFVIPRKLLKSRSGNEITNVGSESSLHDKHCLLREIRKAHLELCKLSREINLAFGIQNLLSMGVSFVMITGLLYTIYSAFSWEDFTSSKLKEIIPSAIWTMIYALKIWMVNHTSWSVSSEADQTGQVIYDLLNSKVDEVLQREIQEFGMQILQNPIRFNACGFFALDHTFVHGAIGSITTYLVILIQMSHAYEIRTYNSTQIWNGSEILTIRDE